MISTLFRTTPQLYRALGYEEVGALTWTAVPTTAFAGLRAPTEIGLRAADAFLQAAAAGPPPALLDYF